jgi:hypothetical protein
MTAREDGLILAQGGEVRPAEIRQYCQPCLEMSLAFMGFQGLVASIAVKRQMERATK